MLDKINPVAILEKASEFFAELANMFQYTPQIHDFLTTKWNWHEAISLFASYPLSMFYHFRYALIIGIIIFTIKKLFR